MLIKNYVNKWGKEFFESENFNWSWRTHTTEYSIMWWCCGKTNKEAPGCTMSKHESREDEEDDATIEEKDSKLKQQRWMWCKERGHTIANWTRDPNFRFGEEVGEEYKRILKNGGGSNQNSADRIINTTMLLKNLCKEREKSTPFTIGWLKFDDYNYDYINSIILLSPEQVKVIQTDNLQMKNKSCSPVLNEEALEVSLQKWGEIDMKDFQAIEKDSK